MPEVAAVWHAPSRRFHSRRSGRRGHAGSVGRRVAPGVGAGGARQLTEKETLAVDRLGREGQADRADAARVRIAERHVRSAVAVRGARLARAGRLLAHVVQAALAADARHGAATRLAVRRERSALRRAALLDRAVRVLALRPGVFAEVALVYLGGARADAARRSRHDRRADEAPRAVEVGLAGLVDLGAAGEHALALVVDGAGPEQLRVGDPGRVAAELLVDRVDAAPGAARVVRARAVGRGVDRVVLARRGLVRLAGVLVDRADGVSLADRRRLGGAEAGHVRVRARRGRACPAEGRERGGERGEDKASVASVASVANVHRGGGPSGRAHAPRPQKLAALPAPAQTSATPTSLAAFTRPGRRARPRFGNPPQAARMAISGSLSS